MIDLVTAAQRKLSRDEVLDVTLVLAQEGGLGALTMREVAARLGVTPMALYRHVGDKQGLLDGLVDRLLDELPPLDPAFPWPERLARLVDGLRVCAHRRPDVFLMLLVRPPTSQAARRMRHGVCAALVDAGASAEQAPRIERLLSTFALGFAAAEAGGRFAGQDRAVLDADLAWLQEQIVRLVEQA